MELEEDPGSRARMVDVGSKEVTERLAIASGRIRLAKEVIECIRANKVPKGNVFEVARIAGIMAAKRTDEILPLCHPLPLESVEVHLEILQDVVMVRVQVRTHAKTGVEMEALTAVAAACLTVYDMCKPLAKGQSAVIECIQLEMKSGGRRGTFIRKNELEKEGEGSCALPS
ncbi:MAG: cyclic pyranopterin monophosphate synthase MoaC [Leptospirillum sp.]